jgi:hypothetical protein
MKEPAPIALFAYRRPDHLRRCLDALRANTLAARTNLFVFSDGARNPAAAEGVAQVRSLFGDVKGFASVNVVERSGNWGLARSIIAGVTDLVQRYGRVIVVEDDLLTSPHFLQYMNDGLDLWADRGEVASIHGYFYPVPDPLPETFFLKGADCWGWATWKRAWDLFEPDGGKLLRELRARKAEREFDRGGYYPYTRMLEDQIEGKNDSWAIRWHASAYLAGRLTLYPGRSLVRNIGMDALATHTRGEDIYDSGLSGTPIQVAPIPLREDPEVLRSLQGFFRGTRPSWQDRIANKMKSLLGKNR